MKVESAAGCVGSPIRRSFHRFFLVRYPCSDVIPVWDYPCQSTDSNATSTVALCPGDAELRNKRNHGTRVLWHLHQANHPIQEPVQPFSTP